MVRKYQFFFSVVLIGVIAAGLADCPRQQPDSIVVSASTTSSPSGAGDIFSVNITGDADDGAMLSTQIF